MMRRRKLAELVALGLLAAAIGPGAARAQDQARGQSKKAIDPDAIAALERMGTFLRTLKTMQIDARTTTDDVLDSGQKVQHTGVARLVARRPDRLRVEVNSDVKNERMQYDGHTFTIFQPRANYYASFDAPPTLDQLVTLAEKKYGLDLPLADLFYWGTERSGIGDIRGASRVGVGDIDGTPCDHFAFHENDVDWEVFIQRDGPPLPRKLVITTITERSQPQHTATLTWNLSPQLDEQIFTFTPPPGAQRIPFQTALENRPGASPEKGEPR